jgi:hypothetical protein
MGKENQIYTIKRVNEELCSVDHKILSIVGDHEKRLQALEAFSVKAALTELLVAIGKIADPERSAAALEEFRKLCDALGIVDLEVC